MNFRYSQVLLVHFFLATTSCGVFPHQAPETPATLKKDNAEHAVPTPHGPLQLPRLPLTVIRRIEQASVHENLCADLAQGSQLVEQCALELLANGTAARILVISDCGAHSCDVENHLFTSGREPLVSKGYGASSWEVTPDHQFLVTGGFTFEAADSESYVPPAPTGFALTYTDLDTGKVAEIAACIAPRLSPSGKWILCRTFNGSVARVLTSGGTLEIIVPVKLPEGVGIKIGGPFGDYPSPVVFISEEKFSYSLYLDTEEVSEHEVSWSD